MRKIYIIQQENTDLFKIGFTKNKIKDRIKQLQTGNSNLLLNNFVFESKFSTIIEKTIHRLYKHYNKKGEWFNLNSEKLNEIKKQILITHNNLKYLEENKI